MYSNPTYNEKFNLAKNFIDNKEFNKAYDLLSSISDKSSAKWFYLMGIASLNLGYYEQGEEYLKKAGLGDRGLSVHKLRHTAATLMYQHGNVDVLLLKEILGHENLSTTEIYTHISNDATKKAVDSNPLSSEKPKW